MKKKVGPLSQSSLFTLKLGPKIHKALPLCMRCVEAVIVTAAESGMTHFSTNPMIPSLQEKYFFLPSTYSS